MKIICSYFIISYNNIFIFISFRIITWYLTCNEIVIYYCMKWHEDSSRCTFPGNDHLTWKP